MLDINARIGLDRFDGVCELEVALADTLPPTPTPIPGAKPRREGADGNALRLSRRMHS